MESVLASSQPLAKVGYNLYHNLHYEIYKSDDESNLLLLLLLLLNSNKTP